MKTNYYWIFLSVACISLTGCDNTKYEYPFRNPSLSVKDRAADIVSRLTLDEKIDQMLNTAPAIEHLGIPAYDWWNECLHGVARTEYKVTVYPQAIGMAAGWDVDAMKIMADYTAEEGRAVYNLSQVKGNYKDYHGLTFWTPNINIFRDPRWGRGQETYGEDPYLTTTLGTHFVEGLQGTNKIYLKAAACAKHYAVHSGPEWSRHTYNAQVSDYDLWDTYLPAFKELVDADVAGVMCAYNAFDGQPCCGSDKLLIDILRNDWGFTGYVTSDCGAIDNFYRTHKTHPDAPAAAADAVFHGTDVDCGREAYRGLKQAVEKGLITEAQIDVSLRRLFEIRLRLGMFDPANKNPYSKIDSTALEAKAHKDHALKMARQSIVLLKNEGLLPLDKKSIKKIAVVGPNANNPEVQLGNYNGFPSKIVTPLDGIKEKLPNAEVIYDAVCNYVDKNVSTKLDLENHIVSPDGKEKAFSVAFYNNINLEGNPVYTGYTPKVYFSNEKEDNKPMAPGVNMTEHSSRFEGIFESPLDGKLEFKIEFDDAYRFYIDGKMVTERWNAETRSDAAYVLNVQKGKKYRLKLEQRQLKGNAHISLAANHLTKMDYTAIANKVKDADVIVFAGGISPRLEGEEMDIRSEGFRGGDRTSILLPEVQTETLKALKMTGKPIIFVLMNGSAISFAWESMNIDAIVDSWYGGESAGTAIADVLFGDYNPSGRLPVTFYQSDDDLPDIEDYSMLNRTYKYFKGTVLYPFGFGLSYTHFGYKWGKEPKKEYKAGETIQATLKVTNSGKTDGDEVSQVYIKYPQEAHRGLPLKELRSFDRKSISAGGVAEVKVSIPVDQFAKWDAKANQLVVPSGVYTIYAGGNSDDEAVSATFEIK
ncbi:beta-glucosidase [Bacteroidia bacterium]|nr:beta-glucosidase [Bacteroidia bacterium]